MNEHAIFIDSRPPSLEEYIPLGEDLMPAPTVDDALLAEVYN